jgi:hypothetical protein
MTALTPGVGPDSSSRHAIGRVEEAIDDSACPWRQHTGVIEPWRRDAMSEAATPARILIVAHHTANSPELRAAIAKRAAEGPCSFTLLVPASSHGLHRVVDPEDHGAEEARRRLDAALPSLSAAAGAAVVGVVGSYDPLAAVQDALHLLGFDEVIVSMLPAPISRWLRLDLPHKIRGLGLPVAEVVAADHTFTPLSAA